MLANLNFSQQLDPTPRDAINILSPNVCLSIAARHSTTIAPAQRLQPPSPSTHRQRTARHHQHDRGPKTSQPCCHRNQQYSIVGLTNAAGTLVERYSYTAYGTLGIYAADGTVRTSSTYNNRYTYTGREWDHELKLYHFRARWYDPATGGFISRDPLGYVDGMSLYRGYFGVREVDPSGSIKRGNYKVIKDGEPCSGGTIGHEWDWEFEYVHYDYKRAFPGHQHGWAIQRIEAVCITCDCDKDCNCTNCVESDPVIYFEAWHFGNFHAIKQNDREAQNVDRTTYGGTDGHSTWGLKRKGCKKIKMKGEARFLTSDDRMKDSFPLIGKDKLWQQRKPGSEFFHGTSDCRITAGTLHTYMGDDEPKQWKRAGLPKFTNMEPTISYEYETVLNCCGDPFKFEGSGDFPTELDFYQ